MKVLLPASEVSPIIKFGGLGDVTGSLPKELEKLGVNIDVAIPFYPAINKDTLECYKSIDLQVPFESSSHLVEVYKTKLPDSNVDVLMFKNDDYFSQGGKSAFANDISETEMFSFFDRTIVEYIKAGFNTYDLVHCNDWHTGLITHILADEIGNTRPATLFTIHNMLYQGLGDLELVRSVGFVPGAHPLIDWDIADGDLNMLQQGISSSDYINTVSPTYAKEILTPEYGGELHEILVARSGRISGILNGIGYDSFPRDFTEKNWVISKSKAKDSLQESLGLCIDPDVEAPLFSFIGRLDAYQKGLDILFDAVASIIDMRGQFILLGVGDFAWEEKFKKLGSLKKYKDNVSINIVFDVGLAEKIYKGTDFLLVPSRYEPCGLIQMIAMHYGTLPVVHGVGGLKDSVKDGENGFIFDNYTSMDLERAVARAFNSYKGQDRYEMVKNALRADFSWEKSAKDYLELYKKVIGLRKEQLDREYQK